MSLEPRLPVLLHSGFIQRDRPITYLHVHDCLEIGFCHRGSGIFMVGQKVMPFRSGDVSVINHTEVHLAQSAPGTDSEWTWIYLDPIRLVTTIDPTLADTTPIGGAGFANVLSGERHESIRRIVVRLIDELQARRPHFASAVRALTGELMVLLHRLTGPAGSKSLVSHGDDELAPAMQHLAANFRDPVDVPLLARRCALSVTHFRRRFVRAFGRPPREYWLDLRIRMASSLLQGTRRSVLQISQDVGFDSLSSFNRQFLKTTRMTPRAFRDRTSMEMNGNDATQLGSIRDT